jgi:hypothetical protein
LGSHGTTRNTRFWGATEHTDLGSHGTTRNTRNTRIWGATEHTEHTDCGEPRNTRNTRISGTRNGTADAARGQAEADCAAANGVTERGRLTEPANQSGGSPDLFGHVESSPAYRCDLRTRGGRAEGVAVDCDRHAREGLLRVRICDDQLEPESHIDDIARALDAGFVRMEDVRARGSCAAPRRPGFPPPNAVRPRWVDRDAESRADDPNVEWSRGHDISPPGARCQQQTRRGDCTSRSHFCFYRNGRRFSTALLGTSDTDKR